MRHTCIKLWKIKDMCTKNLAFIEFKNVTGIDKISIMRCFSFPFTQLSRYGDVRSRRENTINGSPTKHTLVECTFLEH